MNYPRFKFSKHLHSFQPMVIVKIVPLVPFMAQMAEIHIDTRKSLRQ